MKKIKKEEGEKEDLEKDKKTIVDNKKEPHQKKILVLIKVIRVLTKIPPKKINN